MHFHQNMTFGSSVSDMSRYVIVLCFMNQLRIFSHPTIITHRTLSCVAIFSVRSLNAMLEEFKRQMEGLSVFADRQAEGVRTTVIEPLRSIQVGGDRISKSKNRAHACSFDHSLQ